MIGRSRAQRVASAVVFATMLAASVAPAAYAFYFCRSMGALAQPCCGKHLESADAHEGDRLVPERCCTQRTASFERAPFQVVARADDAGTPSITAPVDLPVTEHAPVLLAEAHDWWRIHYDSGPPILLQSCTLLI